MKSQRKFSIAALVFVACLIDTSIASRWSARAQEFGDPVRGAIQVQRICGTCHGVARGEASPNRQAPNFSDVANIKGISGTALNVALLTPHHDMPNLVLDTQQRADVIAYLKAN